MPETLFAAAPRGSFAKTIVYSEPSTLIEAAASAKLGRRAARAGTARQGAKS